ncbi:hypothetical protein ACFL5V_11995 [Fibrobacterota bacterium]
MARKNPAAKKSLKRNNKRPSQIRLMTRKAPAYKEIEFRDLFMAVENIQNS